MGDGEKDIFQVTKHSFKFSVPLKKKQIKIILRAYTQVESVSTVEFGVSRVSLAKMDYNSFDENIVMSFTLSYVH